MTQIQKRILEVVIWNCHNCPYLRYYGESGCRVYTPAHYSCSAVKGKDGYSKKIINVDDCVGDDIPIPEFCPIPLHQDVYQVCHTGWEHL